MYLLTHSLVLVLVAVMKPKVLKTKISHADPPTLSWYAAAIHLLTCLITNAWKQGYEATRGNVLTRGYDWDAPAGHITLHLSAPLPWYSKWLLYLVPNCAVQVTLSAECMSWLPLKGWKSASTKELLMLYQRAINTREIYIVESDVLQEADVVCRGQRYQR